MHYNINEVINMWIADLASKIKDSFAGTEANINFNANINKVNLMNAETASYETDILYVAELSEFQSFDQIPIGTNLLMITTAQTGDDHLCKNANTGVKINMTGNVNIIKISSEASFYNIFNRIQDFVLEANRYSNGSALLLECIIKGKELRDIIEIGYDILNNPIMLLDTSYKVLSYKTDAAVDDPVWADLVENGYSSLESVSLYKNEHIIERIIKSKIPFILDTGVGEKIRRILGKIVLKDTCAGYLIIMEYNRTFTEPDIQITQLLCDVIASMMMSTRIHLKNASGMLFENIMLDLLEGRIKDRKELEGRLHVCRWQLSEYLYVVTIDISRFNDLSFIDYFRDQLNKIFQGSKTIYYNDLLIMAMDMDHDYTEENNYYMKLDEFLKNNDFYAGISRKSDDLFCLNQFYRQSERALYLGKLTTRQIRRFHYRDYSIADLIFESSKNIDMLQYCHPGVLRLKSYDEEKNTDYYKTLFRYLENDKNVIATSEALFIHRNTVNYRLEKIEEFLDFSLKNSKETLQMYLTYKILEMESYFVDRLRDG